MDDYSAGHITTEEAHRFIAVLKRDLDSNGCTLHPGISYRHLMVMKNADPGITTCAPHDITGRAIEPFLPQGPGAGPIRDLMKRSQNLLNGPSAQPGAHQSGQKTGQLNLAVGSGNGGSITVFSR